MLFYITMGAGRVHRSLGTQIQRMGSNIVGDVHGPCLVACGITTIASATFHDREHRYCLDFGTTPLGISSQLASSDRLRI